jgi:hypothetical protein
MLCDLNSRGKGLRVKGKGFPGVWVGFALYS